MDDAGQYLRLVVRLFPDYADTVIWFAPGPVDYADARVSDGLRDAMIAWEQAWYDGMTDDLDFASAEIVDSLAREGRRLAEWLAVELGDTFEIELLGPDAQSNKVRLRGTGAGTNPAAVAAFRQMAEDDLAEDARMQALIAGGANLRIVAGPARSRLRRLFARGHRNEYRPDRHDDH